MNVLYKHDDVNLRSPNKTNNQKSTVKMYLHKIPILLHQQTLSFCWFEDPELLYSGSIKLWNASALQVSKSFFTKMLLNSSLFCFIIPSIPHVSRPLTHCCKGAVSGATFFLKQIDLKGVQWLIKYTKTWKVTVIVSPHKSEGKTTTNFYFIDPMIGIFQVIHYFYDTLTMDMFISTKICIMFCVKLHYIWYTDWFFQFFWTSPFVIHTYKSLSTFYKSHKETTKCVYISNITS